MRNATRNPASAGRSTALRHAVVAVLAISAPGDQARAAITQVVVPNVRATTEGNAANFIPFGRTDICENGFRYQQILDRSEIATSGFITAVEFRLDEDESADLGPVVYKNVRVVLSSSANPPSSPGVTFEDNIGPDATTVFSGNLTAEATAAGASPYPFDFRIPVRAPFFFDGTANDLLIDVVIGKCAPGTDTFLDAEHFGGYFARIYSDDKDSETGPSDPTLGLVTRLTFSSQAPRMRGLGGNWTVVGHNGEGFMIHVTENGQLVVIWFTYDHDGDQMWLIGSVDEFNTNTATMTLQRLTGPSFGPDFSPNDRMDTDWGTLEITFEDCDSGTVSYESVTGFGSGTYDIARLYQTEQGICP